MAEDQHVTTQLVVYANEGHGFVDPAHRRDVMSGRWIGLPSTCRRTNGPVGRRSLLSAVLSKRGPVESIGGELKIGQGSVRAALCLGPLRPDTLFFGDL